MAEGLDALAHWRANPTAFIEEVLVDPETGQPFVLLDAERRFLEHAFATDDSGRLVYPEQVYSAPKKSGKTAFAAMHIMSTLVFGGSFAEGYCAANDFEQSQGAYSRLCAASVRKVHGCAAKQTSPTRASSFQQPARPSRRLLPTMRAPQARTPRFRASMSCGALPLSAVGGFGMKWCPHQRAKLAAD